ncbi:MAG: NAD-dependent epimerase/dehydratase family protein, partial [Bacteroidota bacterium]|nr:NAD-dependent epimerase/dehydratase family protein [Bacteroidota bacterium]
MSKVFITGGAGLLGSNIIRELLNRNYEIVCLVEKGSVTFTIDQLPIRIITGDILDPDSYESEMKTCEFIIHAAASTSVWPVRSELVNQIN